MASSPTPSTVSAVNKVFSTFELLEHILLHLPLRQLLLAQRINKAASDVFTNSHNIRRALFLKAGGKDKEAVHTIVNPFLAVRHINIPTFEEGMKWVLGDQSSILCAVGGTTIGTFACWREDPDAPRPGSNRDKMLLTSPPTGKLLLYDIDDDYEATLGSDLGTTHGDIYSYGCSRWEGIFRGLLEELRAGQLKREEVEPAVYDIDQARAWKPLKRGVDSITGFEMLEIMDGNPAEVATELRRGAGANDTFGEDDLDGYGESVEEDFMDEDGSEEEDY